MGTRQVATWINSLRDEFDVPIFLNADHTHSIPSAVEAAKAGFDWVVFDVSTLPFADNVRQTKQAVEAVKAIRPDILVEGEVGDIGKGSEIHAEAPSVLGRLTTAAEARQFVQETRIDTLAPAVGNAHGLVQSNIDRGVKKRLNLERIREIKAATQVYLTLHGASGTDEGDLRQSIGAGITVVHINTELRIAWRRGLDSALASRPHEIVPYKLLPDVVASVKTVIDARLSLISNAP